MRWALVLVAAGCLTLVRPELLISLGALVVYVAYRALREERANWRVAGAIPLAG